MIRILSQIINLVPYHQARWEAVARLEDVELTVVQMRSSDDFKVLETKKDNQSFLLENLNLSEKRISPRKLLSLANSTLDRHKPDVVVISGYSFPISLAFLLASRMRSIPVVVCSESTRNDFVRNSLTEWIKSRVVRLCSTGLVGGISQKEYLQELGMAEEQIFTGYNAVDNDHFEHGADTARNEMESLRNNFNLPESYFIAVSRFTEKKNLPGLIDAYAEFRRQQAKSPTHMVIAGDGPLRCEMEERIASHQLKTWVHLPGPINYEDLPSYFGLAQGFIHASTTEQWGLVVNEALASGLPAAVSDRCGCVQDLIQGGIHGRTFDPYSNNEITAAMTWLDSLDKNESVEMVLSARQRVSGWHPRVFAQNLHHSIQFCMKHHHSCIDFFDRMLLQILMFRSERA